MPHFATAYETFTCDGCGETFDAEERYRLGMNLAEVAHYYSFSACSPKCYSRVRRKVIRWQENSECQHCGEDMVYGKWNDETGDFERYRADVKFCSTKCRVAAHRAKKNA